MFLGLLNCIVILFTLKFFVAIRMVAKINRNIVFEKLLYIVFCLQFITFYCVV